MIRTVFVIVLVTFLVAGKSHSFHTHHTHLSASRSTVHEEQQVQQQQQQQQPQNQKQQQRRLFTALYDSTSSNLLNAVETLRQDLQKRLQQQKQQSKNATTNGTTASASNTTGSSSSSSSSPSSLTTQLRETLYESILDSIYWWDDLAPPFNLQQQQQGPQTRAKAVTLYPPPQLDEERRKETNDKKEAATFQSARSTSTATARPAPHTTAPVTHFCFLVHGYRGRSRDLSYLRAVMDYRALQKRLEHQDRELQQQEEQSEHEQEQHQQNNSGTDTTKESTSTTTAFPRLYVHATVSNERKTDDGIVNGGQRLVEEMIQVIRQTMKQQQDKEGQTDDDDSIVDVTISMVGNSLGGIYARYAIAKLAEQCRETSSTSSTAITAADNKKENDSSSSFVLDGRYRIHFNVFCTTAAPHLGIASHTFLPLPRTAEIGVAHVLGETGRDLFRLNDLLRTMATAPSFLQPLALFSKRIAYANAYGTDFPVPTHTAAFLSEASDYPHHFIDHHHHDDNEDEKEEGTDTNKSPTETSYLSTLYENGLVVATLRTPAQALNLTTTTTTTTSNNTLQDDKERKKENDTATTENDQDNEDDEDEQELLLMSKSLDSLGWKKVFVDIRSEVPKISLPTSLLRRRGGSGIGSTTPLQSRLSMLQRYVPTIVTTPSSLMQKYARLSSLQVPPLLTTAASSSSATASSALPPFFFTRRSTPTEATNEEEEEKEEKEEESMLANAENKNDNAAFFSTDSTAGTATTDQDPTMTATTNGPIGGVDAVEGSGAAAVDSAASSAAATNGATKQCERVLHVKRLRRQGVVASKDVAAAVSSRPLLDVNGLLSNGFHWPVGHNMMVAFSRSRLSAYMNKAGRPVVDALAMELVDDIFAWNKQEKESNNSESKSTYAGKKPGKDH